MYTCSKCGESVDHRNYMLYEQKFWCYPCYKDAVFGEISEEGKKRYVKKFLRDGGSFQKLMIDAGIFDVRGITGTVGVYVNSYDGKVTGFSKDNSKGHHIDETVVLEIPRFEFDDQEALGESIGTVASPGKLAEAGVELEEADFNLDKILYRFDPEDMDLVVFVEQLLGKNYEMFETEYSMRLLEGADLSEEFWRV